MVIRTEKLGEVTVIALCGDSLDAGNSTAFKEESAEALMLERNAVLDLAGVEFVDSSGLGALLSCLRKLRASGGDLVLCGLSHQVQTLLEVVRMDRIFKAYATREEALAAFS